MDTSEREKEKLLLGTHFSIQDGPITYPDYAGIIFHQYKVNTSVEHTGNTPCKTCEYELHKTQIGCPFAC